MQMMIVWSGRCYVHLTSYWHATELQSLGGGESPIVAYIVRCNRVAVDLSTKGSSARDQATMGSVFLTCWPLLQSTCANVITLGPHLSETIVVKHLRSDVPFGSAWLASKNETCTKRESAIVAYIV